MEELHDEYAKKKLKEFVADILRVGCVKGFRYFSMYLRGREELLVKVLNEQVPSTAIQLTFEKSTNEVICDEDVDTDVDNSLNEKGALPRSFDSLMISKNTQRSLSGFHFLDIGLPPASPCDGDLHSSDSETTMFLIAAYARYRCPYVWVRSNHERLIRFTDDQFRSDESDDIYNIKDSPLKLKTTTDWLHKDLQIWDILAEIVRINVLPCPKNPFALNFSYFDELDLNDRLLESGAMIYLLQRILITANRTYHSAVSKELEELLKRHFKTLKMLSKPTS